MEAHAHFLTWSEILFVRLVINSSCNRIIVSCLNNWITVDIVCEYFCDKALTVHKSAISANDESQKQEYTSAVTVQGNVVTEVH